jgi:hypothetical protein
MGRMTSLLIILAIGKCYKLHFRLLYVPVNLQTSYYAIVKNCEKYIGKLSCMYVCIANFLKTIVILRTARWMKDFQWTDFTAQNSIQFTIKLCLTFSLRQKLRIIEKPYVTVLGNVIYNTSMTVLWTE